MAFGFGGLEGERLRTHCDTKVNITNVPLRTSLGVPRSKADTSYLNQRQIQCASVSVVTTVTVTEIVFASFFLKSP